MKSFELIILGLTLFLAGLFVKYILNIEPNGILMAFGIIMAGIISYLFELINEKRTKTQNG